MEKPVAETTNNIGTNCLTTTLRFPMLTIYRKCFHVHDRNWETTSRRRNAWRQRDDLVYLSVSDYEGGITFWTSICVQPRIRISKRSKHCLTFHRTWSWIRKMRYLDIRLMYCGSLASVRSPEPASPYPVSGFIVHVAVVFFFWLQTWKHRLASVPRPRENFQTVSVFQQSSHFLLSHQHSSEAHHQPLQPPRCTRKGGGGLSVLHSGVEQQSFAHTVWPLRALHFTIHWRGMKSKKGIHTTHTIRAQSHWHGFCRTTKTAVATQSCMSTIPWLRTILLHDRATNLSKTKAHVHLDSVLCLGKIHDHLHATAHLDGKMEWFMKSHQWRQLNGIDGERVESKWTIFPGHTLLELLREIQKTMTEQDATWTILRSSHLHVDAQRRRTDDGNL